MINKFKAHSFSIPVMGIGFTIDTAVRVAPYGISSVISLADDILIEKMREFYSKKEKIFFKPISDKIEDYRAKRITEYLNLIGSMVKNKFNNIIDSVSEKGKEFDRYIKMLPDYSVLKQDFNKLVDNNAPLTAIKDWALKNLSIGSIDVNIMTKLDKTNYKKNKPLPLENNDAFAALRGFANSNLNSSVVFSAGMNPKLYSYIAEFNDFFPDDNCNIKKKIILKVSDMRSALIQGQFFAKKGIWVSEYRIESGLNCGGHAFATDGLLLGPILEEFKLNRNRIVDTAHKILCSALKNKGKKIPQKPLPVKVTAQGGIGTAGEQEFLLDYYKLDGTGWGSPFLLVPEVANVDKKTFNLLKNSKENDLYLSDISPLGVKFNSIKGNTKDLEKQNQIKNGNPGSNCPKRYLVSNTEFTEKPVCTASKIYINNKLKQIKSLNLSDKDYNKEYKKIMEKSCICVGLGTASLLVNNLDYKTEGDGVSVCPGPNMAYFDKKNTLEEMIDHIYGRNNVMTSPNRPNMFLKELLMYIDYFKEKTDNMTWPLNKKNTKFIKTFEQNIILGIAYYKKKLIDHVSEKYKALKPVFLEELYKAEKDFLKIQVENERKTKLFIN